MKRLIKVLLLLILTAAMFIAAAIYVYIGLTKDAELDENKLTNYSQSITICDNEGNEITNASLLSKRKSIQLEELQDDTINAFISSEDRTFYSHNGLNYKRMLKALYTNILSRSFKEGASTISQQLIKNTHLTGDKTIKRKLSEIKLTKKLEKKYTKDQILEMYLNTIYFGHNCYGLESASEFYFGKTADALTLEQSATMVGLLTSPNNYSPFKSPEKCLARRNIVLDGMYKNGYINKSQCEDAKKTELSAEKNNDDITDDYINAVLDELEDIGIDFYQLNDGCKIRTCLDKNLQNFIEGLDYEYDNSVIVTSKDGKVKAYKSTINGAKRQPGSTVKPILVYAPAIEENIISPDTKILDEKVNYSGYSPENYDKKYHGYVTAADSLKYSYNIPAVKILNALTLEKAEKYAIMSDIALDKEEKNLSLALGGMKYGLTLKELCDRYAIFQNSGIYKASHFIEEITLKNGKTIYTAKDNGKKVYSAGTCSLINDMLMQTSKEGTAKKLKNLPYDIASKTGTCGNSSGNTDAYCISYTSSDVIGVWLGDKDNQPKNITGGNDSAGIVKQILERLYENEKPESLDTSTETQEIAIDLDESKKNNKIMLSDDASPKLAVKKIKVLNSNIPKLKSNKFSCPVIEKPSIFVKNNTVLIQLCQTYYYSYLIKRKNEDNTATVYDGKWTEEFYDEPEDGRYEYSVTPYFKAENKTYYSKTITLPSVIINKENTSPPQEEIPDIVHREWYNE
ncbi:MAG: penicillin-binding protein [Clostridia bacterium]|nr:penicillin-binding protein [Clostridia bacterium]